MNWKFVAFVGLMLLFALAAMVDQPGKAPVTNRSNPFVHQATCQADAECVPAECCHATQCVPVAEQPDCRGIACTEECKPGTLDCGQMKCGCVAGKCVTKLF